MQTRKMILSGVIAIFLAMSLATLPSVFAGSEDIGAGPGNDAPQVYLLKKAFDVCKDNLIPDGSVPPSGQQFGCVKVGHDDYDNDYLRTNQYLFEGEQVAILVAVRDLNGGALDILRADLAVDGDLIAKCNEITNAQPSAEGETLAELLAGGSSNEWFGHDVSGDLKDQPPGKSAGTDDGFDTDYDKLYECIFTLTPDLADGDEHTVTVIAEDQSAETGESVPDQIWFDPAIEVDVFTSDGGPVAFADGWPEQTVYSTNTLKIHNAADGGVVLAAWIAGSDLTSSESPSKCPVTNVLDSDNIEFRCKSGVYFENEWETLDNPDDTKDCKLNDCQGADPIVKDIFHQFILPDSTAECWFRLTYPVPCVGLFDQGSIYVYVRAL